MILNANALQLPLADNSVQCVVTSPPYYGLRDYGIDGQIGLEETPEQYVTNLVAVFREVRRVLREDGTCWMNLGDSYAGSNQTGGTNSKETGKRKDRMFDIVKSKRNASRWGGGNLPATSGLKPKDLIGIPWRVALALQADGWWLRSDIIWHKPNPMPESVTDRPTKAHEYLFLLTKSARYYFDADAVREENSETSHTGGTYRNEWKYAQIKNTDKSAMAVGIPIPRNGRNIRSVWTIATQPTPYAHFATFPEKLVEPCIKAGTSERGRCPKCSKPWVRVTENNSNWQERKAAGAGSGSLDVGHNTEHGVGMSHDLVSNRKFIGWQPACTCNAGDPVPCIVFDPFMGSGTVERVAIRLRRHAIGTELNYKYIREIASIRTSNIQPVMLEAQP